MKNKTPIPEIEQRLEELKYVPSRDPQQAARGRANFLNEAANYRQAVSPETHARQSWWIFPIRKEKLSMNAVIAFVLATVMLLGGGATTVAAQDDLPTEPLYQLKLWTENARLSLAGDPQEQAALLMQMSQTRVEEMAGLIDKGIVPPAQVQDRLEQHLQQALMLATNMGDPDLTQTLLQLRDRLQTQDRIMEQLQIHATTDTEPLLTQTRQMLQTRLMLVEEGLVDPQGFRYLMTNQMQYGQDDEVVPEPNQQGEPGFHQNDQTGQTDNGNENQNMNGQDEETPGNQFQNNSGNDSSNGQGQENQQGGDNSGAGNGNGSGGNGGGNK